MPHIRNLALLIIITGALAILPDMPVKTALAGAPVDQTKIEEAQAFFENGVDSFNAKKYDEARNCFSNAISCNPEYAEAHGKLGDILEMLKEEELAYESYQRCIEIIKNMESPSAAQTILLNETIKKTAKFRDIEEKIIGLDKDFTAKLLVLAGQCMTDADHTMAKEIFSLILQGEENNEEATQGLQQANEEIEKGKAEEEQSGKDENSQLAESCYKSGLTQMEQKDYETAITKFKKAIAYRAEYPEALFKLGEAYEKNKQLKESVNSYRECRRLLAGKSQRTKEEEQLLAQALRRLDQLDTNGKRLTGIKNNYTSELFKIANQCVAKKYVRFAGRILNRILEIDPSNKSVQELLGKLGEGAADSKDLTKTTPKTAKAFFERGKSYFAKGELDKAIADFDETIKSNPQHAEAYRYRGICHYAKTNYNQAEEDIAMAIKLNSKDETAFLYRGHINQQREKVILAIGDYTQALKLNPKYVDAYGNRGIMYFQSGQYELAIGDLTNAIKLDAKYGPAYCNRALTYEKMGNFKAAIADAQMFIEVTPKHSYVPLMQSKINAWRAR
ncbi:MAG: tetratricopeptide repeat protein [Planctomycetota bacterium]